MGASGQGALSYGVPSGGGVLPPKGSIDFVSRSPARSMGLGPGIGFSLGTSDISEEPG